MSRHGDFLPRNPHDRVRPVITLPAGVTLALDAQCRDDPTECKRVTFKEAREFQVVDFGAWSAYQGVLVLTDPKTKLDYAWIHANKSLPPY